MLDAVHLRAVSLFQVSRIVSRLCELLVVKCQRLKRIRLKSGRSDSCQERQQQDQKLKEIGQSLVESTGGVELVVEYDDVIHDREIRFDNGWIVKIGRGLDIFKGNENEVVCGPAVRHCQTNPPFCSNHKTCFSHFLQRPKVNFLWVSIGWSFGKLIPRPSMSFTKILRN